MKRLILALALSLTLASCGGSNPTTVGTPAPPQNSLDLTLAKSLLEAQTIIEQAKSIAVTRPDLKDPINAAIAIYNTAELAYKEYHAAIVVGGAPDATAVQAQVARLTSMTQQIKGVLK